MLPAVNRTLHSVEPSLLETLNGLALGALPWPLLLFGPSGTGKTSAALALCDIVETAAYWNIEDLAGFVLNRDAAEVDGEFNRLRDKDLIVVDELGCRQKVGDLHYTVMKRLADLREQHAGRAAIWITNLQPKQLLDLYDERIYSRITCGTLLELAGADRRKVRA